MIDANIYTLQGYPGYPGYYSDPPPAGYHGYQNYTKGNIIYLKCQKKYFLAFFQNTEKTYFHKSLISNYFKHISN